MFNLVWSTIYNNLQIQHISILNTDQNIKKYLYTSHWIISMMDRSSSAFNDFDILSTENTRLPPNKTTPPSQISHSVN